MPMPFRRWLLATACLLPLPAMAQQGGVPTALDAVTATATRAPRPIAEVPSTVTVIEGAELDRRNATRLQDVVRDEPGLSVSSNPTRVGGGNFIIRGIGDNRVRVLTDGVRLPDFPESNIGPGTFTRDFVDLDTVRRIEILRGPASALYGSDAIGGVVNFITKDPGDYLTADRNTAFRYRFGYSGADNSLTNSILGAARGGNVDAMLLYTRRDGHEVRPNGRLSANPQDYTTNSLLGRVVWRATPSQTFRLTGEILSRDTQTDLRTDRATTGAGAAATTVQNSRADDNTTRARVQLDWSMTDPLLFADRVDVRAWWANLNRSEQTEQDRYVGAGNPVTAAPNRYRYTLAEQLQNIYGIDVQARTARDIWGASHRLTYGASFEYVTTSRPRSRFESNLLAGTSTQVFAGETFPNKNFPDTDTYQTGLYLQDEFSYGRATFLPAIRLDWYSLRPNPDGMFRNSAASSGAASVQNLDAFAASPKFGVTYRLDQTYSVYGQYARGFRAPPYDTANFGFSNRLQGYEILPNGNLKPEYVDGFEAGFRGRFSEGSSFQLAGFYNRYTDFINTQVVSTIGGFQQFQYRNIGEVEIWGFEARGEWRINPQLRLRAAAAYAHGEDRSSGRPIDGVDPLRGSVGINWRAAPNTALDGLSLEANASGAVRNTRVSSATYFRNPAYAVLDLVASYDIRPNITLNLGLFNVADAKYFLTSDTRGLTANSALRDLYAQPGRYVAAGLIVRF